MAKQAVKKVKKTTVKKHRQFFEIVNWKKAQPRMKGAGNAWLKVYTSLLDNDAFGMMEDSTRVLIIGIWLYAARSGHHIMPADPKWLKRKIPFLHTEPDLMPLMDATDMYGKPTPFLQYCEPPRAGGQERPAEKKTRKAKKAKKTAAKKRKTKTKTKTGTKVAPRAHARSRARVEQSRPEQSRVEDPTTLTGCGKEKKERKTLSGFSKEQTRANQSRTNQTHTTAEQSTAQQSTAEPEKPVNPKESEAGSPKVYCLPKATRSAFQSRHPDLRKPSRPQRIGKVIDDWIPPHWRDFESADFGWEMVRAFGMPADMEDKNIRSEAGAFAKFWYKLKQSADGLLLEDIKRIAFEKALFVCSNKAKSAKNRRAVWFHIMYGELSKFGVHLKRNGPAKMRV